MTLIQCIVLAIIEGLTEFLPISSTGHMILASSAMGIEENQFVKNFEVIIQFGAILAVVCLYWKKFLPNFNFYQKLFFAFLPTGLIGFFLRHAVDQWLGNVQIVAWTLIIGGILLIWSDQYFKEQAHSGKNVDQLTTIDCIKLGIFQSLAIIPGVSRSASTILGGMSLGLSRFQAAEFSFFLAVPTMAAATIYKLYSTFKHGMTVQNEELHLLVVGSLVSFFVALIAVKSFIGLLKRYGFRYFGWYRIVVGLIILALLNSGIQLTL